MYKRVLFGLKAKDYLQWLKCTCISSNVAAFQLAGGQTYQSEHVMSEESQPMTITTMPLTYYL
jgi:hypothetical protein